jgi:hypothetical protein
MDGSDIRMLNDRRLRATAVFSRYTLWGRRRTFRRKIDQQHGGYVDRYGAGLFFVILLIVILNVFDSVLTLIILNNGGEEVNPIMDYLIQVCGNGFWVWKFIITSCSLLLLCIHSQFKRYKAFHAILAASFIYVALLLYQVLLITHL